MKAGCGQEADVSWAPTPSKVGGVTGPMSPARWGRLGASGKAASCGAAEAGFEPDLTPTCEVLHLDRERKRERERGVAAGDRKKRSWEGRPEGGAPARGRRGPAGDLGSPSLEDAAGALLQAFPRRFSAPMWKLLLNPDLRSRTPSWRIQAGQELDSTACPLDRGTGGKGGVGPPEGGGESPRGGQRGPSNGWGG